MTSDWCHGIIVQSLSRLGRRELQRIKHHTKWRVPILCGSDHKEHFVKYGCACLSVLATQVHVPRATWKLDVSPHGRWTRNLHTLIAAVDSGDFLRAMAEADYKVVQSAMVEACGRKGL